MIEAAELYSLTHSQQRIWQIEELHPHTCINNIGGFVRIQGLLAMTLLEEAIHLFLLKNAGLRHQLTFVNGEVKQYLNQHRPAPLRLFDFRLAADPEHAFNTCLQQEFTSPFVLLEQPLYDFALVHVDENTCGYFVKLHHIVADGWAIQLMTDQISSFYEQLVAGHAVDAQPDYGYRESIDDEQKYLTSERFHKDQAFWQQAFTDLPETFLAQSSSDLTAHRKRFTLDGERTAALRQFVRQKKWSLNTIFVSALLIYLHKLQQQDDLIIGIPIFNRRGAREKRIFGMFTSTMPFRKRITVESTIENMFSSVNDDLMKCLFHQKYPYDLLIQDLGIGQERINRLFQVCMNYYNTKPTNTISGYSVENIEWFNGMQIYALQMVVKDWSDQGTLQCFIDYKQKDYSEEQINRLFAWLIRFIDIALNESTKPIKEIDLLFHEERKALIYDRNLTVADYPRDQPVQQLFEAQVVKTPSTVALICGKQRLTYDELNRRSNQLAQVLRKRGVTREVVVGLLASYSIELIISIWAIMKAGGAYLPLDPDYPLERIHDLLLDSHAHLLLTNQKMALLQRFAGEIIDIDDAGLYTGDASNLPIINQAGDLVYIIYTSGSTGQPKGIMIEHRALLNYIWWAKSIYFQTKDDSVALYSSIAFDLTVTSIFTPLINGNSIVIYQDSASDFVLKRIIRDNLCSVVKATPSHLALLDDDPLPNSRINCFIVGGEDLRTNTANALWRKFGGNIRIFNEYGPTETTVGCMIHEYLVEQDTAVSVPIGHPINNMQVYLLTDQLQPVPTGVVAELFVAGEGLARGYVNRDDLTAERFIANPFHPQTKMYRTGDLARYHNGTIEYLGRIDDQVKIQGYRIELTEVESALLKHEAVKQAVVVLKTGPNTHKYLAAFVQLHTSFPTLELKRFLAQSLPAFMIPTLIIEQQHFPLSQNGKIDRSALAQLEVNSIPQENVVVDPDLKNLLLTIVTDVLQMDGISLQSNLYLLGADSVKAIQIASRLNDLGYRVKARDILTYPVLQELALVLEVDTHNDRHVQPPCEGIVGTTPILAWFRQQNFHNPDYWHQSVLLELHVKLSPEAVNEALQKLVQHHDSLRLNYDDELEAFYYNPEYLVEPRQARAEASSRPYVFGPKIEHWQTRAEASSRPYVFGPKIEHWQVRAEASSRPYVFGPKGSQVLEIVDVSEETTAAMLQSLYTTFKSRFSLRQGLLFRALLIRGGRAEDRLLLVAHHIVIDGVSWRIILEDLQTLLVGIDHVESTRLPAKTASVQHWAQALQMYADGMDANERTYWQRAELARTALPRDYAEGVDVQAHQGNVTIELSSLETQLLMTDANRTYATQVNDLLVVALASSLAHILHSKEITLELETHGREDLFEDVDVSRTVGWFTAIFPITITVQSSDLSIIIPSIKQQLGRIPHKGIGFGVLAYVAKSIPVPATPGIRFNYLGEVDNGLHQGMFSVQMDDTGSDVGPTNHLTSGIDIIAMIWNKRLRVTFHYSKNRYKEATIQTVAYSFLSQLRALISECCQRSTRTVPQDNAVPLTEEELSLILED